MLEHLLELNLVNLGRENHRYFVGVETARILSKTLGSPLVLLHRWIVSSGKQIGIRIPMRH